MLNNSSSAASADGYYGKCAYCSEAIPSQKSQTEELNRTGLDRSASLRLPWGNTRDVMPPGFLSDDPPKKLRRLEKRTDRVEDYDLQVENSHECFRHAPLAFQGRFFDIMSVIGKFWSYVVSPLAFFMLLLMTLFRSEERRV